MTRHHRAAIVLFSGLVSCQSAIAQVAYRTIVLSDQQMPPVGSGVTVGTLGSPTINDAGEVVFAAGLQGTGTDATNDSSLWIARPDGLHLVAREAQPAAGMPEGVVYGDLWHSSNAMVGNLAFSGLLRGTGISNQNDFAIWTGTPSSLQPIARKGDPAPGTPSTYNFGDPFQSAFSFTRSGQTMVAATSMPGAHHGLFAGNGTLSPVAFGWMPIPSLGPDAAFGTVITPRSSIGPTGQAAFIAEVIGSGIDANNDEVLWGSSSGGLRVIAREGAPAPGTTAAFTSLSTLPGINARGDVLFAARLAGDGVNESNNVGLWLNSGPTTALVARTGDAAPMTSATLKSIQQTLLAGDHVAFGGSLTGPGITTTNDLAFFTGSTGNLTRLAGEGDSVPGVTGAFIDHLRLVGGNGRGQLLFEGRLRGEGIDDTNRFALWLTDEAGELHLLVRAGDQLEVAPGDVRQIRSIPTGVIDQEISGGDDGRPIILNDQGQVALRLSFTDDSSGIFVLSIPEPLAISFLPAAALLMRRRR